MPRAYLKTFGLSGAPELIKVVDPVIDGVQDDEREKAVVQSLLEGLQHAAAVGVLHLRLVLVLENLEDGVALRGTRWRYFGTDTPPPPRSNLVSKGVKELLRPALSPGTLTFLLTLLPVSGSFSTFSTSVMK